VAAYFRQRGEGGRPAFILRARDHIAHVTKQRDELQDKIVREWARCPKCGLPVPMSGAVCIVGVCKCGYAVTESDVEPCNPVEMVAELLRYKQAWERIHQLAEEFGPLSSAARAVHVASNEIIIATRKTP
jgi:hypothetical protein